MNFVKWMRLLVWHIETSERKTICGLLTPEAGSRDVYRVPVAGNKRELRVCRLCKDRLP